MSYDFVIEMKLKQETPMIHFQHDSSGATLRASEVKPKLDRYIKRKYLAEHPNMTDEEKKAYKKWFIGDTDALDYKMSIHAVGTPIKSNTIERECKAADLLKNDVTVDNINKARRVVDAKYHERLVSINQSYFGNMVTKPDSPEYKAEVSASYKETVLYKNSITLKIVCLNNELRTVIEKYLISFFINTNFGCRQTKGFGSFLPTELNGKRIALKKNEIDSLIDGEAYFWFDSKTTDPDTMMEQARIVYSVMKAGLNGTRLQKDRNNPSLLRYKNPEAYIRGFSMGDFLGQTGSEKAKIKKFLFRRPYDLSFVNGQSNQEASYEYKEYNFIRAVLGLADNYDFRDAPRGRTAKIQVYHYPDNSSELIQRFPSPVTIKIIDHYVYFVINDSYKKILNKTFLLFKSNGSEDIRKKLDSIKKSGDAKKARNEMNGLVNEKNTIKTPDSFAPVAFVEGFVKYFNKNKLTLRKFGFSVFKNPEDFKLEVGTKEGNNAK